MSISRCRRDPVPSILLAGGDSCWCCWPVLHLMYRLGLQQLTLARQQRDFVSAVSHELKTPLTSIRMYGEMLSEGLAPEDRKPEYYRFIFDESERLSRLIDNVLQLARLERRELPLLAGQYGCFVGAEAGAIQSSIAGCRSAVRAGRR